MICEHKNKPVIELTPKLTHYGKEICPDCGSFLRWIPKPDSDTSKYRRPNEHRELAKQYSRGFCEMCLTKEEDLPDRQVLIGHHVVEYQDNGPSTRENVWVICIGCSRVIHLIRTYYRSKTNGYA